MTRFCTLFVHAKIIDFLVMLLLEKPHFSTVTKFVMFKYMKDLNKNVTIWRGISGNDILLGPYTLMVM